MDLVYPVLQSFLDLQEVPPLQVIHVVQKVLLSLLFRILLEYLVNHGVLMVLGTQVGQVLLGLLRFLLARGLLGVLCKFRFRFEIFRCKTRNFNMFNSNSKIQISVHTWSPIRARGSWNSASAGRSRGSSPSCWS